MAILITQCLQRDFVQPVGPNEPLPNRLHVGYAEARRLMGEKPAEGPVARALAWAYAQPPAGLLLVHLRDWHSAGDPAQAAHLAQFREHCLAGTPGAEFVFAVPPGAAARAAIVDSLSLSDFHETALAELLAPFAGAPQRAGLLGVWTEAKITFLAYELRARYPHWELAVCSALTAGSSRAAHFLALENLSRLLGVKVCDTEGEFLEFLGGRAPAAPPGAAAGGPELEWAGAAPPAAADEQLLRYLFRDCRRLAARPLAGGWSGNLVLACRSTDLEGREQVPHVVKIGPREAVGRERTAFERLEAVLGNSAPAVADFADFGARGGIKYRYAGMGRGASRTFQERYREGLAPAEVRRVLDEVFAGQLGRLYRAAVREKCDLLEDYGFAPRWAAGLRRRAAEILGPAAQAAARLDFPGGRRPPHPAAFYEGLEEGAGRRPGEHYVSWVHGDLNGANIILDARDNVWIIDFFHARRGHVLQDAAKLENDLCYLWTPLADEPDLAEALALTDRLLELPPFAALPPAAEAGLARPALARCWETLRALRAFHPGLVHEDRDPNQLRLALLRYAAHTLAFPEAGSRQKRWALYAAGALAEKLANGA